MNLKKEFKGWHNCTKKQKMVYLEQFLHRYQKKLSHWTLDRLLNVLYLDLDNEE